MVDRTKGLLNISANFEPQLAEPFDGRLRVKTKASLLLQATWLSTDGNVYIYKGIAVSVYDDTSLNNGLYILKESDYTIEGNWEKVGSGGGGTPAGSDGYVQFNDAGTFGADADLYWDKVNKKLGISNISPVALLSLGTEGDIAGSLSLAGVTSGTVFVGANPNTVSWDFYFPITAGIDGYVLTTDGNGITTWTPGGGSGGSTLNQSYDYGGPGAGRSIEADAGAVEITVPDLSNNSGLSVIQNDSTNNPNAVEIENNSSGYSISLSGSNKEIAGESSVSLSCFSPLGTTDAELNIVADVISGSSGNSHLNLYSINQGSGDSILDVLAMSLDGGNSTLNITSDSTLGTADIINTAKTDIIFNARSSGQIPFNEVGYETLVGFTTASIIGALNELKSAAIPTRIESGNTFAYVRDTGSDGYFAVVTEGVERLRVDNVGNVGFGVEVPTSSIDVNGNVEVGLSNYFYYGDPSTNGTWRTGIVNGEFVIERRELGLWVTKGSFS